MTKEKCILFSNHFVYIAIIIQIIFFVAAIIYAITNQTRIPSYFYVIYFSVLYVALLYGYIRFNKSIIASLLSAIVELLIFAPVIIVSLPYQCKKCESVIQPLFYHLFLFALVYFVGMLYVMAIFHEKMKKIRPLLICLPCFVVIIIYIILKY